MKGVLIGISIFFISCTIFAQESLISDLLNIEPVVLSIEEMTKDQNDQYLSILTERTMEVDNQLTEFDEKFRENVSEVIDDYHAVLNSGNERVVKARKFSTTTSFYSLSMELLKNKKQLIREFNSEMISEVRKLPSALTKVKEEELQFIITDYQNRFLDELDANKKVIRSFEATEHMQVLNE